MDKYKELENFKNLGEDKAVDEIFWKVVEAVQLGKQEQFYEVMKLVEWASLDKENRKIANRVLGFLVREKDSDKDGDEVVTDILYLRFKDVYEEWYDNQEKEQTAAREAKFAVYDSHLKHKGTDLAIDHFTKSIRELRRNPSKQKKELEYLVGWTYNDFDKMAIVTQVLGKLLLGIDPDASSVDEIILMMLYGEVIREPDTDW